MFRTQILRKAAAVATEAPRMTIAKNILQFQAMRGATNEAALAEAAKPVGNLDVANLPPAIAELEGYLSTPVAAAGGRFSRDPTAWQNKEFVPFVADAASYTWFWPFLVGGAISGLLFGVLPAVSLSKEGEKDSRYMLMIEGKAH